MIRFGMFALAVILGLAGSATAQFQDDDFNAPALGGHWTVHDSTPPGSTFTATGTHLRIVAQEGSDFWSFADNQAFIEQDAPGGTNWEVVTKLDNFDPMAEGARRTFIRSGIQLWQDNGHFISVGVLGNADGTEVGIQAFWQTDTDFNRHDLRFFGENYWPDITTSPIYLKLQKTEKGYQGMVSGDGVDWDTVLPIVRNPGSADGYFQNEKIRLYQSGGPAGGTGVSSPVDFDFIESHAVAVPAAGFVEEEFSGPGLAPTFGFYPGFRAGSMTLEGGLLKLHPGILQDVWELVDRSMYVYQDAPTALGYTIEAKVGPSTLIPYEQWMGYGIMLWQDQCNWLLLSNQRSETGTNRVEVAFKRDGLFDIARSEFGAGALPAYLRIVRNGDSLSPRFSHDGSAWTAVPVAGYVRAGGLRNAQVRLIVKRVFDTGPVTAAEFDYLHAEIVTAAGDWQMYE